MQVHLFGGASSPSVETVKMNFHVDDGLMSVRSDDEAIRMASQLLELLPRGGFRLTRWNSTSQRLIMSLTKTTTSTSYRSKEFCEYSGTFQPTSLGSVSSYGYKKNIVCRKFGV